MSEPRRLGQLLIDEGHLSASDLERALKFQSEYGGRLGEILIRLGMCSENAVLPLLARQLNVELVPGGSEPDPAALLSALERTGFPADWFAYRHLIPWVDDDGTLNIASRSPADPLVSEVLESGGSTVRWHLLSAQTETVWLALLERREQGEGDAGDAWLRELAEEAPVVSLVNNILSQAVELGASDIHLEPENGVLRVRYRIDGVLVERMRTAGTRVEAVVSRVKLMANLDIAERRLPQDGRISVQAAGIVMDVRISTMPDTQGESVVLRLLPKDDRRLNLDLLGLPRDLYGRMQHVAHQPHGLLLVTGPTGSGKSTTLYALLNELNNGQRKIITVEDPVENSMNGVVQVQVNADIGMDFARALRSILRQDPDVIMIGEIRDRETARIAVQSSLTGHAVLSTLHTNDALSAVGRLIDIGVEPFLLSSAARGILAQRLVRRLCVHCREPMPPPDGLEEMFDSLQGRFPDLMAKDAAFYSAKGCERCLHTGYSGRAGIYEWIGITPGLAHAISRGADNQTLTRLVPKSFRSMREDGLIKCWNGQTTLDEVFRVAGESEGLAADEDKAAQNEDQLPFSQLGQTTGGS